MRCPPRVGSPGEFKKVPFKVSTSLYLDETAALCDLLLPGLHALERWDDLQPRRGVIGLMQPVMQPVFNGMATGDVLLKTAQKAGGAFGRFNAPSWEAYLKTQWQTVARAQGAADTEGFWRAALQRGGVYTEAPVTPVRLSSRSRPDRFDSGIIRRRGRGRQLLVRSLRLGSGRRPLRQSPVAARAVGSSHQDHLALLG